MSDDIDPVLVQDCIAAWRALPPLQRARASIARLFIDTDHDNFEIAAIAEQLIETEFSPDALQKIYLDEIVPIAGGLSIIGVWPAFDFAKLNTAIEKHQAKSPSWLPQRVQNWRRDANAAPTRQHWDQIYAYLNQPARLQAEIAKLRAEAMPGV
jgi:hypothetical protein